MKIGFENFRIFSEFQEFDLLPITLLTGPNNSGKSTVHVALSILKNSFVFKDASEEDTIDFLNFEGISSKTGDFDANISFGVSSSTIIFYFRMFSDLLSREIKIKIAYEKDHSNNNKGTLKSFEYFIFEENTEISLFNLEKNNHRWIFTKFNIDYLIYLFNEFKQKGVQQRKFYKFTKKVSSKNELTVREKQNIQKLEKEGYNFDDKKLYEYNSQGNPLDWTISKNGKPFPYVRIYEEVLQTFCKINDLVVNSEFLEKIHKKKIKLEDIIPEEKINNQQLIDRLQEIEAEIIYNLILEMNMNGQIAMQEGKKTIYFYEEIASFMRGVVKSEDFGGDFKYLLEKLKSKDALIEKILEIEPWDQYAISIPIDPLNSKNKNHKKVTPLPASIQLISKIIYLFWEEFLKRLVSFITVTKMSLFDVSFDRHILFDDTTKFQKTLSIFAKLRFEETLDDEKERFIRKWMRRFELGTAIETIKIKAGREIIGAEYYLRTKKSRVPLGNNGIGANQLLLVILQLAVSKENTRFLLEEPEGGLHPAFQSKLAELFLDAYLAFGHNFIIETHSEYLIRKFQFLVAKKKMKATDIKIYYLGNNQNTQDEKRVKELTIREDGMMDDDFGPGFFDESVRLTLDLLKLQNRN